MAFYENLYRLRDGAIVLYTRASRKKATYQAHLKIPGAHEAPCQCLQTKLGDERVELLDLP